jgi:demethylmenaquinone methyltransferase/2-methoxy-6-polyprenyl-1,4-benzoquinol methylase
MKNAQEIPDKESSWKMFNTISSTYDKVNRAMTGYRDIAWRKAVGRYLPSGDHIKLLDCATGTADQIITLMRYFPQIDEAIGIDKAEKMLEIGQQKIDLLPIKDRVQLVNASALDIPYKEGSFDCVTMSFGIRNVSCISTCFSEIYRVLRPGGRLLILESSLPKNPLIKLIHLAYLRKILPSLGAIISKEKSAYVYLNKTIESFPYGATFCHLLEIHKFSDVKAHSLMLGAVSIYQADKPYDGKEKIL